MFISVKNINFTFLLFLLCSILLLEKTTPLNLETPQYFLSSFTGNSAFDKAFNFDNSNSDYFQKHLLKFSQLNLEPASNSTANITNEPASNSAANITNKTSSNLTNITQNSTNQTDPINKTEIFQNSTNQSISNVSSIVEDFKSKVDQQILNTQEINNTVNIVLNSTKKITKKIKINQARTEIKLNIINKHIVSQIRDQLNSETKSIQHSILTVQKKIKLLNLRISQLKLKIPKLGSKCLKLTNCGSCVANDHCGWCSMTQVCMEGNERGASDGSCTFFDYKVKLSLDLGMLRTERL